MKVLSRQRRRPRTSAYQQEMRDSCAASLLVWVLGYCCVLAFYGGKQKLEFVVRHSHSHTLLMDLGDNEKATSVNQLVSDAKTVKEILSVAPLIKVPGEPLMHWEKQLVHRRRRQRGAASAIVRLSKMLVGWTNVEARKSALTDNNNFNRLLVAATSPIGEEEDVGDVRSYATVVRAASTLLFEPMRGGGNDAFASINLQEILVSLVARLDAVLVQGLLPDHELDGLYWAAQRIGYKGEKQNLASLWAKLDLPFSVHLGLTRSSLTLDQVVEEVQFEQSVLTTRDKKKVVERRKTCWMAEKNVGGLAYSGKIMSPVPFSPCIASVRDHIEERTGQYFDCCLINLYEDGDCACAYHSDPDLGTVFARESFIVSVGETRRFNIKRNGQEPHIYHVFDGDVFCMERNCNDDWIHSISSSEGLQNNGPRVSIVFKRTIPGPGGKRGHGLPRALPQGRSAQTPPRRTSKK